MKKEYFEKEDYVEKNLEIAITLPCTRKMVSTTTLKTVSAIITDMERLTKGRPWEDLGTHL